MPARPHPNPSPKGEGLKEGFSRALISVFDKTGLEELARGLSRLGVEIVSTGGTLKFLEEKGIPVTAVSAVRLESLTYGSINPQSPA